MKSQKIQFDGSESALKQIRCKLGLSQQEFAQRLGTSLTTISRWERGARESPKLTIPQIKKLVRLLAEMGLTIDDIPDRFGPSDPIA